MRICAGGLLVRDDRILLARRAADRDFYPGVWDVIGGHCEGDEAPVDTLARELVEEIGVRPRAFERIAVLAEPHPAEHGEAQYHIFVVTAWGDGEPRLRGSEHTDLGMRPGLLGLIAVMKDEQPLGQEEREKPGADELGDPRRIANRVDGFR